MALIKIISVGDELIFDLRSKAEEAKEISVTLTEKAGRQAVLRISADRSIPIKHFRQQRVPETAERENNPQLTTDPGRSYKRRELWHKRLLV